MTLSWIEWQFVCKIRTNSGVIYKGSWKRPWLKPQKTHWHFLFLTNYSYTSEVLEVFSPIVASPAPNDFENTGERRRKSCCFEKNSRSSIVSRSIEVHRSRHSIERKMIVHKLYRTTFDVEFYRASSIEWCVIFSICKRL